MALKMSSLHNLQLHNMLINWRGNYIKYFHQCANSTFALPKENKFLWLFTKTTFFMGKIRALST